MSQLTIYLDDDTERRLKTAAQSAGVSVSRWVSAVIREKTETTWPQAVLDLAGAWPDLPTSEDLRREKAADAPREEF